jgi:hypothetical protein
MSDDTLDRLHTLTARLTECLEEAADIRARLKKAQEDTTIWPDLRSLSRTCTDIRSHPRFAKSSGNRGH